MDKMNDRENVLELQRYLRILYRSGYAIPSILPNGVFGEGTREAVYILQELFELELTGRVDLETWNAIVNAALKEKGKKERAEPIYPFSATLKNQALEKGDELYLVAIVKMMLNELLVYNGKELEINGLFDDALEDALANFQRINLLEVNKKIDRVTWDKLARQYNNFLEYPDPSL